jgi:hypothetical protein
MSQLAKHEGPNVLITAPGSNDSLVMFALLKQPSAHSLTEFGSNTDRSEHSSKHFSPRDVRRDGISNDSREIVARLKHNLPNLSIDPGIDRSLIVHRAKQVSSKLVVWQPGSNVRLPTVADRKQDFGRVATEGGRQTAPKVLS